MNTSGPGILRSTYSICPVCMRRIPAELRQEADTVRIYKTCAEHGAFSAVVWRGAPGRSAWTKDVELPASARNPHCPTDCGLCPAHGQETCCIQIEVTSRCNLSCRHCLAEEAMDAGRRHREPSLEQIREWITDIVGRGLTFLQITGGEPTLRDDLPEIVRFARASGCEYVQLNSNGLRFAWDEAYVKALAEAGLSFVFMQFDDVCDETFVHLRGKPLLEQKKQAVDACGKYTIGVTLVPTLVPGLNDGHVGDILRYAVERVPVVRGVHFQPISYFGCRNTPPRDDERLTLPEVYRAVFDQAGDLVPAGSLVPSHCDHAACGFHGSYIVSSDGLVSLTPQQGCACREITPAEKSRRFVGRRWQRPAPEEIPESACCDLTTLDGFFQRSRTHAFTISAMAFQDAFTLELERLRQCSLHVYRAGRIVPFCIRHIVSDGPASAGGI